MGIKSLYDTQQVKISTCVCVCVVCVCCVWCVCVLRVCMCVCMCVCVCVLNYKVSVGSICKLTGYGWEKLTRHCYLDHLPTV